MQEDINTEARESLKILPLEDDSEIVLRKAPLQLRPLGPKGGGAKTSLTKIPEWMLAPLTSPDPSEALIEQEEAETNHSHKGLPLYISTIADSGHQQGKSLAIISKTPLASCSFLNGKIITMPLESKTSPKIGIIGKLSIFLNDDQPNRQPIVPRIPIKWEVNKRFRREWGLRSKEIFANKEQKLKEIRFLKKEAIQRKFISL